jgi:hypothetical protein
MGVIIMKRKMFLMAIALIMFAIDANASVFRYKNFDQLVDDSDGVIQGVVEKTEALFIGTEIFTDVTIKVDDILKGSYDKPLFVIRVIGGELNGVGQRISGIPTFQVNEEVILFIEGNGKYKLPFAGGTQGIFFLEGDSVSRANGNLVEKINTDGSIAEIGGNANNARGLYMASDRNKRKLSTGLSQVQNNPVKKSLRRVDFSAEILERTKHCKHSSIKSIK